MNGLGLVTDELALVTRSLTSIIKKKKNWRETMIIFICEKIQIKRKRHMYIKVRSNP